MLALRKRGADEDDDHADEEIYFVTVPVIWVKTNSCISDSL